MKMSVYESILNLGSGNLTVEAIEGMRQALEKMSSLLCSATDGPGSEPIAEKCSEAVMNQTSAIIEAGAAEIGLVKSCVQARLAISQIAERIGVVV
jgi:hypothetical protein